MAIYNAIIRSRRDREKAIKDAVHNKVLGKIKEASADGEVTYFSADDIGKIICELKE